jgi:signal transduction histidine kinase
MGNTDTEFAPLTSVSTAHSHEHLVQFYENDDYLINLVGEYLAEGEKGIVIMTPPHIEMLKEYISNSPLPYELIMLDAQETLDKFMENGLPVMEKFYSVIGGLISTTLKDMQTVNLKTYGEMVALLWENGNQSGAIALEELWNELQNVYKFTLLCAYPIHGFNGDSHSQPFLDICKTHTKVLPSEAYSRLSTEDEKMREIASLQQQAMVLKAEITKRKKSEVDLKNSIQELETLSYSISHDLRAPLRGIIGFINIFLAEHNEKLDESAQKYLDIICDNANQMRLLLDDLISFFKVSRKPVDLKKTEINNILKNVIDDFKMGKLTGKNETVPEIKIINKLPSVKCDPAMMKQVFVNLISNAFKFTGKESDPEIEIGCEAGENENIFYIADNGIGFDMKYSDKLFGLFQRLNPEEYEGTGIGLVIIQRIIQKHGGRVWAEGSPGKGAKFYFSIPA